jgi:hypothetical protein
MRLFKALQYTVIPSARAAAALTFVLSTLFTADSAAQSVPEFSAIYDVRYGVLRGEMTLTLRRSEDGGFVYDTMLRPRGFVTLFRRGAIEETSTLAMIDGELRPVHYSSVDTIARPARETEYHFNEVAGRVTGRYKSTAVDEPMRPGGHDRISVQVAVMQALNEHRELTRFSVFDRARWRDFEFVSVPNRTVKVPYGEFDTVEIVYSSPGKNKRWSLHCAEDLGFVPVMIIFSEADKVKSRAELVRFTRAEK